MQDYKVCTSCVMDTTDPLISFDDQGICHYCNELAVKYNAGKNLSVSQIENDLKNAATLIKKRQGGGKFDCVLGLSGGVDSSYVAHLVVEKMGLSPLIVHFDNGWNSAISEQNIKNIVKCLRLDITTCKLNWDEFKDLQKAFLSASVMDIEMITDNIIYGAAVQIAKQHKIKCIVSGVNFATESGLPSAWRWEKIDAKNIRAIHRRFGKRSISSLPLYGCWQLLFDRFFNGIYHFYPLNLIRYNKTEAMLFLKKRFDWNYYGGKHYESIFTKFYQAYILPTKFGIDKRRAHLSSLLRNQEITREAALAECDKPAYDLLTLEQDKDYIANKLGFSRDEFQAIMDLPPKHHHHYPSEVRFITNLTKLSRFMKIKQNAFA
ncbi:MAG: N-acetyl sugar amidotransferase [Gammaproteobacteria bacterium]|nr:N-acetyl sugar amidotransferase [Gammaproteobacteria bacterium]